MYSGTVLNPRKALEPTEKKAELQLRLIVAIKENNLSQVDALLDAGADVNHRDRSGDAPMHYAVRAGEIALVKHLLARGADINLRGKFKSTPLHLCADTQNREMALLLIGKGAKMTLRDEWGLTVADRAAMSRRVEMANFLREQPSLRQANRVKRLRALRPRGA